MPIDKTLTIAFNKYDFIANRCRELGTDVFETKLLLEDAICMRGSDAAEFFYKEPRLTRRGAAPARLEKTLFGEGGVQGLEGERHARRKKLFLDIFAGPSLNQVLSAIDEAWDRASARWIREGDEIVFESEARRLLGHGTLRWLGVPNGWLDADEVCHELEELIAGTARIGPAHWRARLARKRLDRIFASIIVRAREKTALSIDTPLYKLIHFEDVGGKRLSPEVAAVELNNMIRPVVAVGWFLTATLRAWILYPQPRRAVELGGDKDREFFIQEVRRTYPFFPFVAARVADGFEWKGHAFKPGMLVILDLFGTNHHEDEWTKPDEFNPERFIDVPVTPYNLIPQGGGNHFGGHRCAGEWLTIRIMKMVLHKLIDLEFDVADANLELDTRYAPARIGEGLRLRNIHIREPSASRLAQVSLHS